MLASYRYSFVASGRGFNHNVIGPVRKSNLNNNFILNINIGLQFLRFADTLHFCYHFH